MGVSKDKIIKAETTYYEKGDIKIKILNNVSLSQAEMKTLESNTKAKYPFVYRLLINDERIRLKEELEGELEDWNDFFDEHSSTGFFGVFAGEPSVYVDNEKMNRREFLNLKKKEILAKQKAELKAKIREGYKIKGTITLQTVNLDKNFENLTKKEQKNLIENEEEKLFSKLLGKEDKMKKKDIIHTQRWLNVELSMVATSGAMINTKIRMKEYAEELGGWEVIVDKEGIVDENGHRLYEIKVVPNKEGKMSPEEFRIIRNKLFGFAFDLLVYLNPEEKEREAFYSVNLINFLSAKKIEEIKSQVIFCKTLFVDCYLKDRLELEKKDINLAKDIFVVTFEEEIKRYKLKTGFFNKFTQDKDTIEMSNRYKQRLKDWFNIKVK